jgi:hypothetical protein
VIDDLATFYVNLHALVESWCDRRRFSALSYVLKPPKGLITDWRELRAALGTARSSGGVNDADRERIDDLTSFIDRLTQQVAS